MVTITASQGGAAFPASLTVHPAPPRLAAIAPGKVLAGQTGLVAWGSGFQDSDTLEVVGPVYAPGDTQTPLCDLATTSCPLQTVAPLANAQGTTSSFTVPAGLAPGFYFVRARTSGGATSPNGKWIEIAPPSFTRPVVTGDGHRVAERILSGQTVEGELVEAGDPDGKTGDYNVFYFVGTAGSRIDVAMERVDTSLPWEHPDSLDPEIRVIAPDGFVYENLLALDDRESLDLDASLHDALLPQTGVYVIAASTTRGHGAYRLTFQAAEVAPVGSGDRVIPTGGDCETVLVGGASRGTSLVLDPLGQPLSGAEVTWNASPGDGETGTVRFEEGTLAETSVDGFARARVTHLTRGKVRFGPVVSNPVIASWVVVREEPAFRAETAPRYAPAGSWPLRILAVGPGASLRLTGPPPTEIRTHRPRARAESRLGVVESRPAPAGKGLAKAPAASPSTAAFGAKQGSGGSGIRPDAATAEPLPSLVAPLSPGPCVAPGGRTSKYAVEAAELRPPYTLTLTNEETQQPVGEAGIEDARIESTLTFRLAILDGNQLPPTHPILVRFRVGGPRHGTLILDPGGLRTECPEGSFVWHDVDAEGHLIPNEIFEYRLGTLARYVGVEPDPEHPGQVRPVWGTAEALELQLVVESPTGVPLFSRTFEVHAKPGKPDHFVLNGPADPPHTFRVWPDYHAFPSGTKQGGGTRLAAGFSMAQVYFLEDRYGNKLWGYGATTVVPTDPRVQATFTSQAQSGEEYIGYRLDTTWNDDPEMPDGNVPVTLGVNYNDPDEAIGSGQVTQPITYLFQRGMMKAVERRPSYDRVRPDGTIVADDGTFPMTVSPEAGSEGLPKTEAGDTRRLVLLTLSGHGISGVVPSPEPYPNGHKTWKQVADPGGSGTWHWEPDQVLTGLDPFHETGEPAAFRMTLVDGYGRVAEDGRFVVHRCPRWDHDSPNAPDQPGRECTLAPLDCGGTRIIERVEVNPSAEPLDHHRGYMGIELVKAPTNPGTYYVKLESLDGAPWRISRQSDRHSDETAAGQFQGGFALCTVMSGEFLDGSLNRIDPFRLTEPKLVYLRVTTEASSGPTMSVDVRSERADTTIVTPKVRIDLPRCGVSGIYQAPLLLIPEACPAGPSSGGPSPLASLAVPLGEGRLWATAPAGNALASADSAFPAALRLRFLTRDGSQLTPPDIPAAPEMTGMTQQTVIGDSSDSYAESVWVEIRAENPYDWTQLQDTDAAVGIAESPNTAYLEPTDRFYDGELGSTLLDHTGKIGGDEGGAFLPLQHGSRRQRLSSVANLRWNRVTNTADSVLPYAGSRGARIHPKPAIGMTAADPIEGPILETSQWVDEGTYGRSRGDAPAPPGAESYWTRSQNQVRDWLEKKAWDVWADTPDDASGQVNEMCRIPRLVMEDVFQTQFGLVNSNWPTVVRFNPVSSVRLRRPRPDSSPWELFYYGFYEVAPADGFPSVAIHEARHSFQFTWKARGAVDTDDDFLFAPNSCVTAASAELFDRPNTDDPASSGSGNGDGHFRGDGPGLKDEVASVKSMLEHEAMRFVNRTGNSLGLNCALSAFSLITSPEMTGSAGTALPGGIRVEVSAKESRQGALIDVPRSGVTVRFTVPEGSTALVNGLKRAWVMTNETGQASVDITNGAAGSTTEIAVNLLPPMAPQNECSLFPFATILNVILHAQ